MNKFDDSWYESTGEAQEYVLLNLQDVARVNDQWSKVSEHIDGGDLDNMAMINKVKQVLTEEQDASLRSLFEEAKDMPYEEIARYQLAYERRVDDLREMIANSEAIMSEKAARIMQQRSILESIVPTASRELETVTTEEVNKAKSDELAGLKAELAEAELDLEFINDLYLRTGEAWPIPTLADVHYEPSENEIFTVDQFPNEREVVGGRIAEQVTRHFESRLSDASAYLALLLREKPGHIWTDEELGLYIYDDNEDPVRNGSRARSLISHYNRGKSPVMAEVFGDLVLQRGKRQLFNAKTGKSVPRSIKVVWRLVDQETAINAQTITTMNAERTHRESYGEWEPVILSEIQLKQLPSGDYDGKPLVEEVVGATDDVIDEAASRTVEKVDWRDAFTAAVHKTIEEFKSEGLMTDPQMTWKSLRMRSNSASYGTETARERAHSAKIIKRTELDEDSLVGMEKIIMSTMLNSFPNIFRVSSRRKEAIRIVDEIIAGYFRQHEE